MVRNHNKKILQIVITILENIPHRLLAKKTQDSLHVIYKAINTIHNGYLTNQAKKIMNSPLTNSDISEKTAQQKSKFSLKNLQRHLSSDIKTLRVVIAVFILLVIVSGGIVAANLAQISQELRQQAVAADGYAKLWLKPSSSLPANSIQNIPLTSNMGLAGKKIVGVQFFIDVTGDIPHDLQYSTQNTLDMNVITNSVTDTATGKRISFAMITNPPQTYTTTTSDIVLGNISFTSPSSGQMTLSFDPTLSKIIEFQTNEDILQNPQSETYAFVPPATATPIPSAIPTSVPTIQPSSSPHPSTTPQPTSTSTPIPTSTPGSGGPSTTPQPSADLSLTKSVSAQSAIVGDIVRYTIEVKNSGPALANDISVSEQFNTAYGIKLIATNYSQGSLNLASGTWNVGSLSPNQSATLIIDIEGTAVTTLNNTAQIATSSSQDFDSTPGNNNPSEDDQGSAIVSFAQPPTPTPTFTPIPTNTPRPTFTPIPTNTPRPTSAPLPSATLIPFNTATPRPSVYPTFIPFPTATPDGGINSNNISIDISSPRNGQTISWRSNTDIKANVVSTNQVESVKFYVNNLQICNDKSSPYSCRWRVWIWRLFRRSFDSAEIKAVAQDSSGNSAQHTIQVQVK